MHRNLSRYFKEEHSLKSPFDPKSPEGDFFKLLIFSVLPFPEGIPLGRVRGKNDKNQQSGGFLDWTQRRFSERSL
jgi:hypothetical protein